MTVSNQKDHGGIFSRLMHTRPATRNPFTDADIAARHVPWYRGRGRRADRPEKKLLRHLLGNFPASASLLEVGCGTGHFTLWFEEQGTSSGASIGRGI